MDIFLLLILKNKSACLKCFYQTEKPSDEILNCDQEGILGPAGVVGYSGK